MIDRLFLIELRRILLSAVGMIERQLGLETSTAEIRDAHKKAR